MVIAVLLANIVEDAVKYMFDAISLLYILSPIYVMAGLGWLRKCSKLDLFCTISTILSVGVYIYMFQAGYFADLIMIYVPTVINIVLCGGASLIAYVRSKDA